MDAFAGRTAVVTGAASGIGRSLVEGLVRRGAQVVLADVEAAPLEALAAQLEQSGAPVAAMQVDVRDPDAVEALAARTAERFGVASLVFANAGVSASGATWETTPGDWRWLFEVNVLGVANMVRAFVPPLIAAGVPGQVCITASVAGYLAQPGFGAYNASKHAVVAIAETLAADLREAGHPIGVTLLAPWFVRTQLAAARRNRPGELGEGTEPTSFSKAISARLGSWSHTTQDPPEVAEVALDAVAAGRFAVFPYEPSTAAVQRRIDTLLAGGVPAFYLPEEDAP
jgi:NAD(P)-dependent dehydrogenase (short-subunit alcohol dehydrogenase family)